MYKNKKTISKKRISYIRIYLRMYCIDTIQVNVIFRLFVLSSIQYDLIQISIHLYLDNI